MNNLQHELRRVEIALGWAVIHGDIPRVRELRAERADLRLMLAITSGVFA